ncbi:MAG: hypothetical protein IPP00_03060 [Actinomycetales bacterium]|uniref:Uncharacterized protein n=1 Tax=Candidatus Phosphoribacter hodrii TaxID=2953743 RepID=A0A9D7T7H9_9MICO|nr:hypothetical protein [Candidatus Phosphoribacter hodrii]
MTWPATSVAAGVPRHREGAPYIDSKSDKLALAPDQMATHSFTGQNADQWGEVKVTLRCSISGTELGEIRKPAALAAYSTPAGHHEEPGSDYPTVQITIPLDGPQVATGDNLPCSRWRPSPGTATGLRRPGS